MSERDFDLLVNTDIFLTIFKEDYEALAEVAEDNDDWEKYIKSAIENFYLEFNKIYYNLVHLQSDNSTEIDKYNKAYDLAMFLFASRKHFNAVKMAAPVRRIADLIKSVIGGPIEMIQTSCKKDMPVWQCNIAYLSKLIAAAESCPNIWYHSLVLETMLEYNRAQTLSIGDPIKKALSHVKNKKKSPKDVSQVLKVFEFVQKTLSETKESARYSLQLRAKLYQFITDLQNDGSLDCNNISTPLYVF
ncbi:PREDICTED: uncharacterized protein LOC106118587 [Papilio xuthus]|uniref:Uncharacterized protein LOC106118587 n=1 Tax=Papilio xuthus TaxID=66420 RepID=A0AAJ6ZAU7_PAPXU|nr:PREDICTED: uncharacterized protein LOC106118587 [Papilio xuthus]